MSANEPDSVTTDTSESQRAWLASILLRSQQTWFGRFTLQLQRLITLGRGQRRRLERKAAVSLAGAALVLSLGAGLMQPLTVQAASITVDNGVVVMGDDGQCSIIEAIINANNDSALYATAGECEAGSGADTINLPAAGLFTLTASYSYQYYSETGLPSIDTEIIIEGNGSEITRDSAAPIFRIMSVSATGDLTLNNTTLSNGYSEEDGGGLYNFGYTLIQNSTLTGNYSYDDGGGTENDTGTMVIDNSIITLNSAGELGGGVSTEDGGILTIQNGTQIIENYAYDGGGGLMTDESGLVTIDGSDISDNISDIYGGGIATYKTEIVIQNNTTVTGNETGGYGGGADFYLSDVTITDSTISGNNVEFQGGGLHLDGSTVTIERSTISDNHTLENVVGYFGGGIHIAYVVEGYYQNPNYISSSLTISESTISGNSAWAGGGIYNERRNSLQVTDSTLNDNTAAYGGALASLQGSWFIANSTLSGNEAVEIDVSRRRRRRHLQRFRPIFLRYTGVTRSEHGNRQ